MSKKIQLTVPKPCHENWENMNPVEKGRFCNSCEKQVVDFSDMSDRQIAEFFKKPSIGSVCGRFMSDQLDREIVIPKKRVPWFKYFFQIALPAFIFSIKGSSQALQGKVAISRNDTLPVHRPTMGLISPTCTQPSGMLEVKVLDETHKPIPYASIITGVMGKGGVTNKNGVFNLDKSELNVLVNIIISSGGYQKKELSARSIANEKSLIVLLKRDLPNSQQIAGNSNDLNCSPLKGEIRIIMGDINAASAPVKKIELSGKVIDEQGNPLQNASIHLKGTQIGGITDANGNFSLGISNSITSAVLQASFVGYETSEQQISESSLHSPALFVLKQTKIELLGAVVVVRRKHKELKNVPLMQDHTESTAPAFKIFPNPVEAGTNLNIECKKTDEGYYIVEVLNGSGQSVHHQEIWIDKDAKLLSIDIPEVPTGNYFIVLTNKKSKRSSSEKLIVQ
jgi:hypothetical protein